MMVMLLLSYEYHMMTQQIIDFFFYFVQSLHEQQTTTISESVRSHFATPTSKIQKCPQKHDFVSQTLLCNSSMI